MARRSRSLGWARSMRRTVNALTQASQRAGTRLVKSASKAATKAAGDAADATRKVVRKATRTTAVNKDAVGRKGRPAADSATVARRLARSGAAKVGKVGLRSVAANASRQRLPSGCEAGVAASVAGARRYLLYVPPDIPAGERRPLVVMLHGCGQTSADFLASTGMNRLAARTGFLVLYLEQDRLHHPQGCWKWYATRSGRATAEMTVLLAAIDQVVRSHPADPQAVAVVGLSAGAGMAALLAERHPDRFVAAVMHSGVPPGCASSAATALDAMRGRRKPSVPHADANGLPSLMAIHGSRDTVVAPVNSETAVQRWADALGAQVVRSRTIKRGDRRTLTRTDHVARGRLVASLCLIDGLGHAWSGGDGRLAFGDPTGPDASRLAWSFIAERLARPPNLPLVAA